jgi:hypothetical protein
LVKLGDKVEDVVTGLQGIVTGKASYIFGCDQCCVSPPASGEKCEVRWFDEPRLRIVEAGAIRPADVTGDRPGGPREIPPERR